jgi:alginate O-acetyltransferase complex protein AlgI
LPWILIMILVEWVQRTKQHGLQLEGIQSVPVRWSIYLFFAVATLAFFQQKQEFIYFQF